MSNIMSAAWSAALAEVSRDPGSSAVVMQIWAAGGGKTGFFGVLLLCWKSQQLRRHCGGLAVFLNTRGRFEARKRGDSGLFRVCVFRVARVNRLLSGVFAHLTGWRRFRLPPTFPRGKKVLQLLVILLESLQLSVSGCSSTDPPQNLLLLLLSQHK